MLSLFLAVGLLGACSDDGASPQPDGWVTDAVGVEAGSEAGSEAGIDAGVDGVVVPHKAIGLTLAHMNDTHAQIEPTETNLKLADKDTSVLLGGFTRWVTKIKDLRTTAKNLLVLHAGDAFQGTLYFQKFLGMADLEFFKMMPLDAMVVGNHEFDRGPKVLADFVKTAKGTFPVLGGNVDASKDPDLKDQLLPYIIKEIDGEKVAIIGLVTPDVSTTSSPGKNITFADHIARAKVLVKEVEGKGVNKVILLTHVGYEEDLKLAQGVEGVDVILGGHTHSTVMGDSTELAKFQANVKYGGLDLTPSSAYPKKVQGPGGKDVCIAHSWALTRALGLLNVDFDKEGFVTQCVGHPVMVVGDAFARFNPTTKKVEPV
ncbi:MAG: metallophosphoesterase, partial [Deltaproteobacteria bacterium]|nr:metallophosphoesterase [Deltaproteobacteria bacterium]